MMEVVSMTEVYFVRHAEPDLSIHEDFIRPLSDKGKKDAYNLVTFFNDKKIDAVLSSPFLRAIDTVRNIAFKFQVEIQTVDDFRERKIDGWIDDFNSYTKNQWMDFNYKLKSGMMNSIKLRMNF